VVRYVTNRGAHVDLDTLVMDTRLCVICRPVTEEVDLLKKNEIATGVTHGTFLHT
jgi:hypothetical protein